MRFFRMLVIFACILAPCFFLSSFKKMPKQASCHKGVIILDAGHGGSDEGTKVQSLMEKRVTLLTAFLTKEALEERGYRVILTRSRDVYLSLPKRAAIANRMKGTLFVSIHYNAAQNTEAKGVEVFYCQTENSARTRSSKRLANCVLRYVIDETKASSRGVKQGNYHVIRETEMPAILIEGGFATNPEERLHLKDRKYLQKIAQGIALGIEKYLK